MLFAQRQDATRRGACLQAHLEHACQEEFEPLLECTVIPDGLQALIVALSMAFEIVRQVQHRLVQHLLLAEQEGDQQPADAAVAVEERVDRLKLRVREADPEQQREGVLGVEEAFQGAERVGQFGRRGRDEASAFVQRASGGADPVLAGTQAILVAQARRLTFTLATADAAIRAYPNVAQTWSG